MRPESVVYIGFARFLITIIAIVVRALGNVHCISGMAMNALCDVAIGMEIKSLKGYFHIFFFLLD